jgi:DNA polymerase I-like protein with 3'-5' exonuclease and polymerase domains
MKIWNSTDGTPTSVSEGLWFYNGLDCCVTLEVLEVLLPQLDEITSATYEHSLALQAPVLEIECRGIKIDTANVNRTAAGIERDREYLHEALKEILIEGVGLLPTEVSSFKKEKGVLVEKFLWNSPAQLKDLFYNRFGITPIKKRNAQSVMAPSVDRDALEKLSTHFHLEPIIAHILAIRDCNKKLGVLRSGVDRDGRMRFSLNIAGTDTGRLASYASATGSGTNLQNITEELRSIFVADPGMKLAYIDLAQIQSRAVGAISWNLFHDGTYLDFCESGDLHTGVCMMTWQDKDWKGAGLEALTNAEYYKHNRALANLQFYRQDSFRQGSKKLGHATNFLGQPPQVSKQTRIPIDLIKDFQTAYFGGFPSIKEWHKWLQWKLNRDGFITTLTGRRRWFFGRRWEMETVRKAAAYEPQDIEAYINQKGMYQLWQAYSAGRLKHVELLVPVHDAVLIQYPENAEDELIPKILEVLKVSVPLMHGREFLVPHDVAVGWNWQHGHNDKKELVNPDGLVSYSNHDSRTRTAPVPFLDRKFY